MKTDITANSVRIRNCITLGLLCAIANGSAHETEGTGAAQAGPQNTQHPAETAAANVRLVGHMDPFPGNNVYADVWGDGNFAYLGSFADETVAIIDISDLGNPKLAGTYKGTARGLFEDMQVKNGIAYFASYHPDTALASGVHIVDVSNPAAPVLLKRIASAEGGFNSVHNVYVDGNYLYEADSATTTVKVFDVSTPSAPMFVRNINTTDSVFIHDITVINNRLYSSGWSGRTDIYDVTDIASQAPKRLGTVQSGLASHSSWVSADGKILASCSEYENKDLRLYDISSPATPKLLSRINSRTLGVDGVTPHNPVIMGDLLFVSWYQAGMQVFNIRDPARPLLVGAFDTFVGGVNTPGGLASGSDIYDGCWGVYPLLGLNKVLLSDMDGGLLIVDASRLSGDDVDGDRIPDKWERDNGLDPSNGSDDALDPDGDRVSNLNEFLSGTDPRDPSDATRLVSVQKTGRLVEISFNGRVGRSYRIEKNTRPVKDGWTLVQDEIAGAGAESGATHTNAVNQAQFYRVLVRP